MFRNILEYFGSLKVKNLKDKMSKGEEFELIIKGYVHQLETEYRFIIPEEIIMIIMHYYPKKINYIGKFLQANGADYIKIQQDQLSFTGYMSIKLDQPLPTSLQSKSMSVVYRWRALATKNIRGASVIFGVVSNRCYNFHAYPHVFLLDAYGISMEDRLVFDDFDGWSLLEDYSDYKAFKANEIICMEYEVSQGHKCTLSFYDASKNHKLLWKIDLPNYVGWTKIKNWYPVFSKSNKSGLIKVIPY